MPLITDKNTDIARRHRPGPDAHAESAAFLLTHAGDGGPADLARYLSEIGFSVTTVSTADDLLRACWRSMPSLVMVPVDDGQEDMEALVRRLRALPGSDGCVIFACARKAMPQIAGSLVLAGVTDCLVLPATSDELRRRLRQAGVGPSADAVADKQFQE